MKIENPCSEKYSNMQKTSNGRHCKMCQTNVVDFTKYNVTEIETYFKENGGQKVCGRYKNYQINTPTKFETFVLNLKSYIDLKIKFTPIKIAMLALVSSLLSLTSCFMGKRMEPNHERLQNQEVNNNDSLNSKSPIINKTK